MTERPILFSAPMVLALLNGGKTQTRRVCKKAESAALAHVVDCGNGIFGDEAGDVRFRSPYGRPGDRLWVRETCWIAPGATDLGGVVHCAERPELTMGGMKKRPSIHMPRWASRILLEITGLRVERLTDISAADARAEGLHRYPYDWRDSEFPLDDVAYEPFAGFGTRYSCASQAYRALWESINGAGSWDANQWVWVVEFKRVMP